MLITTALFEGLFATHNVGIRLKSRDKVQLERLMVLWQQLFVLQRLEAQDACQQEVSFEFSLYAFKKPAGETVYFADKLLILSFEGGFYLEAGASQILLNVASGNARVYLAADFWEESIYNKRELFLLALLMLIRPRGLYGLHACGLKKASMGLLIVGSSGSGKTTTTLSLIRSGWQFLSDDAVLLTEQASGVEVLAFRKGFSVMPDVAEGMPDTVFEFDDPEGKKVVNLAADFGGGFVSACTPNMIVFPKIRGGVTQLKLIDSVTALLALSQQSGGIMTDQVVSQAQLEVLKRLVGQALCFELHLAKDVLDDPNLLNGLLGGLA